MLGLVETIHSHSKGTPLARRRARNETPSKAPVRSQCVSLQSKRRASHFRLSEGSNRIQARRSFGCRFLHSERQGQEDRRLRGGQGGRGRTSRSRQFLRRGLPSGRGAASVDG